MATTYKIVLHGIKHGEDLSRVVKRVMALVKLPRERVLRMLTNPGVSVKHGLDAQKAAKYEAVLEKAGCNVILAPDLAAIGVPVAASSDAQDDGADSPDSAAGARGLLGRVAGVVKRRSGGRVRANYEEMRARSNARNWRTKLLSLKNAVPPAIGQLVERLRG
ncbi:MAG TPA: hypothetical protein VLA41_04400 [Burkholderiales bacterium]|nr:hypothetical protein [Burkholderiales bacterium]